MKFIDVHVHGFLKPADKNRFKENITALVDQGLEKIIITALPYHDFDYHFKLSLAPDHIQPVIGTLNPERITLSVPADDVELSRKEWYSLLEAARGEAVP